MRMKANRRRAPKRSLHVPRLRINWRRVIGVVVVPIVLLAGGYAVERALDRPVRRLSIEGPFQRVSAIQIEEVVGPEIGRGFLSVDLEALRERLERLDWVASATVWRRWPGTLSVRVSEHTAAARWGSNGLLNVAGELFTEDSRHAYPELPLLEGPPGAEHRVAELYLAIRDRLAKAELHLITLSMDERGALAFQLIEGQEIRVGREAIDERLERFFSVVTPAIGHDLDAVDYIDLRYSNGFSVGWRAGVDGALAVNKERT